MKLASNIDAFLSAYDDVIHERVLQLRDIVLKNLPGVIEQLDVPAKMIAYCYGQRYADMVCTILPSKKGVKLGFYKGVDLPDPDHLLEGTGKISRYVDIREQKQLKSKALQKLVKDAFAMYQARTGIK